MPGASASSSTSKSTGGPTTVGATTIRLGTAGGKSNVLVDQNGCALYLNVNDTSSTSACDAACEVQWPAVPAPGQPGTGVEASSLGTFQRSNGRNQVTFDGHQLYRFTGDTAPGQANGAGKANFWLVGADGQPVK